MIDDELPGEWQYSKTRLELYCKHGVGHPIPQNTKVTHGCCQEQCCNASNDTGWDEAVKTVQKELGIEPGEDLTPRGF